MSTLTDTLGLLKMDPVADGHEKFNIDAMLNDNWDKIDAAVSGKAPAKHSHAAEIVSALEASGISLDGTGTTWDFIEKLQLFLRILVGYTGDEGGGNTVPVALEASPYTGTAEVSISVDGNDYDVNIRTDGASAPDGTIIIKKLED